MELNRFEALNHSDDEDKKRGIKLKAFTWKLLKIF
jgi:hypothetical protein